MRKFVTPNVVLSRCIEIGPCRYNSLKISYDFVKKLIANINVIAVCPKVEIGLGTPRDALRIVIMEEMKCDLFNLRLD